MFRSILVIICLVVALGCKPPEVKTGTIQSSTAKKKTGGQITIIPPHGESTVIKYRGSYGLTEERYFSSHYYLVKYYDEDNNLNELRIPMGYYVQFN